ncbi:MAG: cation:proton antiporter [Solirubrobacterales bacterium]
MDSDEVLLGLSLVVVLSVLARLLATWIKVPAIVPLLAVGVLAGTSVAGLIDPDALLGDALSPTVQIAVGIILFEGSLNLKRDELSAGVRSAVFRLITFGVLITWALATVAIIWLFDVPQPIGVLIGAIVIVSGPTVVLPILDFISPSTRVRSVLKWEGVLVDPIGAIAAVVIFGSLATTRGKVVFDIGEIVLSLGSGLLAGAAGALLLLPLLASRKLADRDKVAATLMLVVASFAVADTLFADSGLVATIVMGVVLANQRRVRIDYIAEFKETLVPILIGILFILLAANVNVQDVIDLGWRGLLLVAILVFLVRPLAVATLLGLPFTWKEKAFFSGMAPRGIVAASTASAFGLTLTDQGVPGAEKIIPITFFVIVGTVFISALGSPVLGRILGVTGTQPPSLLLIGGPQWALAMGEAMKEAGAEVRVWTEDEEEARAAADAGIVAFGGPLDPHASSLKSAMEELSAVALVSDDDTLNQVLSYQLAEHYEPDQIYRLRSPAGTAPIVNSNACPMFDGLTDSMEIERRVRSGERMVVFGPGETLPEGALPVASVLKRQKAEPPKVLLASSENVDLASPRAMIVALVPQNSA